MTAHRSIALCLAAATLAAVGGLARLAPAQHIKNVRGSLDAVTVVPSTQPAPTSPSGMPAGHPQTAAMPPPASPSAIPGHPGKTQGTGTGALRVIFKNGTPDVATLAKDPVRIELFAKGEIVKTYHSTVPQNGTLELEKLPLDPPFQAVVTVTHGGVEQQLVGPPQHRYQPAIELEMPVFEATAEKPAWTVGLRHIQVESIKVEKPGQPTGLALQVTEMIGVFNPSDRAWTGDVVDGGSRTLALPLAANATNVQFGPGLAEARAKVVNGTLIRPKAMLPGSAQYVFGYTVPVIDGKATLAFAAPADTTLFALYVPGEVKVEAAAGLETGTAGGSHADEKRQLLKARVVKAGQVLTVSLSNIQPPKPPATVTTPPELTNQTTDLNLPQPAPKARGR
jgi:hypothetical protein